MGGTRNLPSALAADEGADLQTRSAPPPILGVGVGVGVAFSVITDTCGMPLQLGKLPYNHDAGCDVGAVLHDEASRRQLTSTARERAPFSSPMRHSSVSQELWS